MNVSKRLEVNGYDFVKYDNGTIVAKGKLQEQKADRNIRIQKEAGGVYRLEHDQGGHLIAAQQNGPAIQENLSAQDGHLNQGPYKTVENAEMNVIRDADNPGVIQTERIAYMTGVTESGGRPSAYMINDTITYADGQTQHVNLSFSNLSVQEQEEYGQMVVDNDFTGYDNPCDTLRETMPMEEYTGLMEETDKDLPNIRDEFAMATEVEYTGLDSSDNSFEISEDSYDMGDAGDYGISDD